MSLFLILLVLAVLTAQPQRAQAQSTQDDSEIQERAAKRLYPGGRDEEELKVLDQVPEPTLKIYKQTIQKSVVESMSGQSTESETNN